MGWLNKIEKIANAANIAAGIGKIATNLDLGNVAGIDFKNLSVDSLNSIKGQLETNLLGKVTGLTTDFSNIIDVGDLESQVTGITDELTNSVSLDGLDSMASSMDFNNLNVDDLLNFDPVSFMN